MKQYNLYVSLDLSSTVSAQSLLCWTYLTKWLTAIATTWPLKLMLIEAWLSLMLKACSHVQRGG